MLYNIFSMTTFFRFLNFGVFAGLVVYLFKRYLLPSVLKQIHEKKLLLQNLENQKQGIKYQLSNLDQALEQQHHLAQELTNKINIWSSSVTAKDKQNWHEHLINQSKIEKNTEIKNRTLVFEHANKKIVPQVIHTIKKDLINEFEQHDKAKKYNNDILRFIKESSQ